MAVEFRLPDIGEGIAEGEIVKWLVKPGDQVKEDQALVEVMTDKVTAEIPSPYTGVIQELRGKEGEVIKVGAVIVVFDQVGAGLGASTKSAKEQPKEQEAASSSGTKAGNGRSSVTATCSVSSVGASEKVLAAPATRKLARQLGVDLTMIAGSGARGRITPDDVKNAGGGGRGGSAGFSGPSGVSSRPQKPGIRTIGSKTEERVPFVGMRRKIAEHLVKSKQTAPHFAYVEEVDMTALVELRKQLKPVAESEGVKLTYLPFIIKAVISGLRAFPSLNSTLDESTQELVYKHYYNIGVATATDQGLIVPVVHHAENQSLFDLARNIQQLSDQARAGRLSLDAIQGGTFTLTSIGSIGGLFGVPIINYPEVAIMGINKISQRPVVVDGEIKIREMMYLSLCCDHRVVDGAEAAQFVAHVIEQLQAPARLLLD